MVVPTLLKKGRGSGLMEFDILVYAQGDNFSRTSKLLPMEVPVTIRVNGEEWVTVLCTPKNLKEFALGFLYLEGVISGLEDVLLLRVCDAEREIEARLVRDVILPQKRILTSGCGKGVTHSLFEEMDYQFDSGPILAPDKVFALMNELYDKSAHYQSTGGIHASGISDGKEVLWVAEDIGRHNTLDKLKGYCLLNGISTEGKVILTTGRISSEMLVKAARMGVPFVVSRTSPTALAVELARQWGITLIGYARGKKFRVYSGVNRIEGWQGPDLTPLRVEETPPSTPNSIC